MRLLNACLLILLCLGSNQLLSQVSPRADIFVSDSSGYGIDRYEVEAWEDEYEVISLFDSIEYYVPFISVSDNSNQPIGVKLSGDYRLSKLTFLVEDSLTELPFEKIGKDSIYLGLPIKSEDYTLKILEGDALIGMAAIKVFPMKEVELFLVPMIHTQFKVDSIEIALNKIYAQAQIRFDVKQSPLFSPADFEATTFNNPSPDNDRFTDQMITVRNAYFELRPTSNENAYYVFIMEGFVDEQLDGYMVRNKSIAFVKNQEDSLLNLSIARQLGFGVGMLDETWEYEGPEQGSTNNLMDILGGVQLTFDQWVSIQQSCLSVSMYDDYEDVRTNSGMIGYYFWEEDENGNIILKKGNILKSIQRPFKRNQYSLHLSITNWWYKSLFHIKGHKISALHIFTFVALFIGSSVLRRSLQRTFKRVFGKSRFFRWVLRSTLFILVGLTFLVSFGIVNYGYLRYEVKDGQLDYIRGLSQKKAIQVIGKNKNKRRLQEDSFGSEVLIKRGENWFLERKKRVLYFDVQLEAENENKYSFKRDSDSLEVVTKDFKELAKSHYMVLNYMNEAGECLYQKVYNHLGKELTDKLQINDPAERILLFVNGYRPTSLGTSFEENFSDIKQHGLEFEQSKNLIYDFDRYDYWNPWKEIDVLFQNRINPSETYYADGHFSVRTSNHKSLFGFTTLSNIYPHRCKDLDNHVCQKMVNSWGFWGVTTESNTSELLPLSPNLAGFNRRTINGTVAGRNLEQMLNELPNNSKNDTLFIVAHSMGYAYALGIIEKMRGKINLGGFYIIAPENASSGELNPEEWQEVWQFGSDVERWKYTAPCLLDGIAPQEKADGLPIHNRVFIPDEYMSKMSFFNAHFVGYYTWIFDIPKEENGFIKQR